MRIVNRKPGSIISEAGAADLIMFISARKEIQALALKEVHKNYARMFQLVKNLETPGILKIVETRAPRKVYKIRLTPKGEKAAEKLQEAKSIVEGKQ